MVKRVNKPPRLNICMNHLSDFTLSADAFASFDSRADFNHSPKRLSSTTSLNSNNPFATDPGFLPALPNS